MEPVITVENVPQVEMHLRPEHQVFVNCPFDVQYLNSLFEPLLFAVQLCGFNVRCALEASRENDRFKRIQNLIELCPLSIHDLSRNKKDEDPRFNMPLELGVFIGCQLYGGAVQANKSYLVLDREEYLYQRYISDINGQDPGIHLNKAKNIIEIVRNWLAGHLELLYTENAPSVPSGPQLYKAYTAFKKGKSAFCSSSEINLSANALTFSEQRRIITLWWNRQKEIMESLRLALESEPQAREAIAQQKSERSENPEPEQS